MDERNNINSFRKKRAKKKFIVHIVVIALLLLAILAVVVNWNKIIAPLKDAALDVGEAGFPVPLPGSTGYLLDDLGENFYLLTDTYIYTYTGEGASITNVQHGFQTPLSSSNDKRVLVYDKNGKSFKLFSRTGEVFSGSVEDTIVSGKIGNDQRSAIVTTSTRYSNYLYVYNGEGKQIFRWASPNYKIMQVEFSDDDKSIFVTALGSGGGELQLYLLKFDLSNSESHMWQTYIGNAISFSVEYCDDGVFVVTSSGAALVNSDDGTIIATSVFSKYISDIPQTDELRMLIFADTSSNNEIICTYGDKLENTATLVAQNVTVARSYNKKCYILSGSQLLVYDSSLSLVDTYQLDDVYSDFIIINNHAYLLGYNIVQRIEL